MTRLGLKYFVRLFKKFLKFEVEQAKKLDIDSVGSAEDEKVYSLTLPLAQEM